MGWERGERAQQFDGPTRGAGYYTAHIGRLGIDRILWLDTRRTDWTPVSKVQGGKMVYLYEMRICQLCGATETK